MNGGLYTRVILSLGAVLCVSMVLLGYVFLHDLDETEKLRDVALTLAGIWLLVMLSIHLVLRSTLKPLTMLTKYITDASLENPRQHISRSLRERKDEVGVLACAFDAMLANLQQSYADLEKREEHYRQLVESANVIPWELDLNARRIRYVGPQAQAILGHPIEDWYQEKFWLNHVHGDDLEAAEKFYRQIAATGERGDIEYRIQHANGKWVWVRDYVHKTNRDPRSPTLQGLTFDVDERVKARLELQRYREHLEKVVDERTAELLTVNQELQSFAHSLSQDLRVPLRIINGFSEAMLEDYADAVGEEGRSYLQRICGGTKKMGQMIEDILILSRVTRQELYRKNIELASLLDTVVEELKEEYPGHEVHFVADPQMKANADPELLKTLLHNLLSNAWKFTQKTPVPRVEFTTEMVEGETVYCIKDNGAGFDMRYVDKLFLPFRRLHNIEEFDGAGVGLAAAKRIVLRHGGRIRGEARPGEGAIFRFTLSAPTSPEMVLDKKIPLESNSTV